jgi:hypothetical protein
MKQCTCGRSESYPYCDESHKKKKEKNMKDGIVDILDENKFVILQDGVVTEDKAGVLGIFTNKIVEIPNFIDPQIVPKMINFFENCDVDWGDIAFYGSSGKGIKTDLETMKKFDLPEGFFNKIKDKYQDAVQTVFKREVKANTSHAQKWDVGGFASPHSDNSDNDGKPNAFEINKYVGILYLNDDYEGGELYFCDKDNEMKTYLSFKPNAYSYYVFPGGYENIHGVSEITKGTRYTMVSFWDYADSVYNQETLDRWEEEERQVRIEQAKQKEEWNKGNKYA